MLRTDRAILVFARTPGCEARHKPLGDPRAARRVHQALLGRLLRALASVRIDSDVVLVLDGPSSERAAVTQRFEAGIGRSVHSVRQRAGGFGERMAAAVAAVRDLGARSLVIVGADSPELRGHHLDEALSRVDAGQSVLGPSTDGGVWLAGAPASRFADVAALPWETARLGSALSAVLGAVHALPMLADLDGLSDLAALVCRLFRAGDAALAQHLCTLVSATTTVADEGHVRVRSLLLALPTQHRGPPACG